MEDELEDMILAIAVIVAVVLVAVGTYVYLVVASFKEDIEEIRDKLRD